MTTSSPTSSALDRKKLIVHRHLVDSVLEAVAEIFGSAAYSDQVIETFFKSHRKWGSRDRKFFAGQVYEIVRWWRKYWFVLNREPTLEHDQLLALWAVHRIVSGEELPDWLVPPALSDVESSLEKLKSHRAARESIPDWLDEWGASELAERWDSILHSLNFESKVDLRVNSLKTTRARAQKLLSQEGIETELIDDSEWGLTLLQRKNLLTSEALKSGLIEVQDRASQRVGPFLRVEPGHKVVDACAGAGGKSLHLASLMQNKGQIVSMDVNERKLKELQRRSQRNGVHIIETKLISSPSVIQSMERTADRVLLDVPCSGLGVLRRNPDAKWKLSPEDISQLKRTQSDILQKYSSMTKVGGVLVYATCSFLPSENEQQVEAFLARNQEQWKLDEQLRIDPDQGRGDGFFAARLIRIS